MLEVEAQGTTQDPLSQDKYILLSSDFRQSIMNELVQLKTFMYIEYLRCLINQEQQLPSDIRR